MQILTHNPEITSYSNEDGHFITGFLIGTKLNDAKWAINKQRGHEHIQKFVGKDFAIIPELINKPLSEGGGGHYFGQDTKDDLLKGYAEHSHGKITRVKGPYSYNDGTDDYYYNFDIKLRDSKAASALVQHGASTWVPYSVSPHIWPLEGPDDNYTRWDPIGVALVIKGAYGPQAVISKMCKGTAVQCEKSMAGSAEVPIIRSSETIVKERNKVLVEVSPPCEKEDENVAQIISSLVSKAGSTLTEMAENIPNTVTNAPTQPELKPEPSLVPKQVNQLSITVEELEKVKKDAAEAEKKTWMEKVTALETKDKINTLNTVFAGVKDPAVKDALIKKYQDKDVELVKQAMDDFLTHLSQQEEPKPEEKPAGEEPPTNGKKSKGASVLPKEPELPKEESKAASVPVNKLQEIIRFQMSGGRA